MALTQVPQNMTQNVFNGSNRNLIQYADFENQSTTGWQLGTIGALTNGLPSGTPTFNTATSNLALSISTTNPIDGTAHLLLTASGATTAGNMLHSQVIMMPPAFRTRRLSISHLYSVISGAASLNMSGTLANSLAMAAWDVTNSAFIPIEGAFNYTQNSLAPQTTSYLQIPYNCASIRFCLYFPTASTGAFSLGLKNFYLGLQSSPQGYVGTNLKSMPTTGTWITNTTYDGRYRQVGQCIEAFVLITLTGAPNANNLNIAPPSVYTIDDTSIPPSAGGGPVVGEWSAIRSGVAFYNGSVIRNGIGVSLFVNGSGNNLSNTNPATFANGDTLSVHYTVPIIGLSSNTQMSSDAGQGPITFKGTNSTNQPLTTGVEATLSLDTVSIDTSGSWNTATSTFTVSRLGQYRLSVLAVLATGSASSQFVYYRINGGSNYTIGVSTSFGFGGSTIVDLKPNDTIQFRVLINGTGTLALQGNPFWTNASIEKLANPASILQSDPINFKAIKTTSQSLPATTDTPVIFDSVKWDTNGWYNPSTGRWTSNVYGKIRSSTCVAIDTSTTGTYTIIYHKNAAGGILDSAWARFTGSTGTQYMNVTSTFNMSPGDYLYVNANPQSAATVINDSRTHFEAEKVG